MQKVDLYLVNTGCPRETEAWYGYVLAYKGRQLHTVEGFGKYTAGRNRRDLVMLLEAVSRCKDCELTVHTDSGYLIGGFARIEHYIEHEWFTTAGAEVKNKDLWIQVIDACAGKEVTFRQGEHEYTKWLKTEIRRRKDAEREKGIARSKEADHTDGTPGDAETGDRADDRAAHNNGSKDTEDGKAAGEKASTAGADGEPMGPVGQSAQEVWDKCQR